jgi:predicted phosphoribosyltransferase/dienelactone hydrolase
MLMFADRDDAGRRLAEALAAKGYVAPIVLGIPRGGVVVAAHVARRLHGQLGVVVARKLGAPGQPELALGAVTADGVTWIDEHLAWESGATPDYLRAVIAEETREAQRRERAFDGLHRPPIAGRTVIIVDDGIATGATALAAVRSLRAAGAGRVVVAVPVGPPRTLALLRQEADDVVALLEVEDFWAVGQFYRDFRPVDDAEVQRILAGARSTRVERQDARIRRDGVELAARLILPAGAAGIVVFVHGLGSSKESPRNVVLAERLADAGIGAVLFDLSGHGDSSPAPEAGSEAYVEDLAAVANWLMHQEGIDSARIAVAGSSLGGVVALRAVRAGRIAPVALLLRAPPAEPQDYDGVHCPVLVIVGSGDPLRELAERAVARHPAVELRVVNGAGHLFEEPGALEQVLDLSVGWLAARL